MTKFFAGVVIGLALGVAASAQANGFAFGWTVQVNNVQVCTAPFIWRDLKLIDCQ